MPSLLTVAPIALLTGAIWVERRKLFQLSYRLMAFIVCLLLCLPVAAQQPAPFSAPQAVVIPVQPGESISRLHAVVIVNGLAMTADPTDATQVGKVIGIAISDGSVGSAPVQVQVAGEAPVTGLTPNTLYYVQLDGSLGTTPLPSGAVWGQYIGYARSATQLELTPNQVPVGTVNIVMKVEGTLTNDQILQLLESPVTIVNAPKSNQMIVPIAMAARYNYNGTPYGNGADIVVQAGPDAMGVLIPMSAMTSSGTAATNNVAQEAVVSPDSAVLGQPLQITIVGSDYTNAGGTLSYSVIYYIATLP